MNYSEINSYRTKFGILITIILLVAFFDVINSVLLVIKNQDLLYNYLGLLRFVFLFVILIIIVLLALNLFKFVKQNQNLFKENERLKSELISSEKSTEESVDEKTSEQKSEYDEIDEMFVGIDEKSDFAKPVEQFLMQIAKKYEIVQGLFYQYNKKVKTFNCIAKYAYYNEEEPTSFEIGEGLCGQAVKDNKPMVINDIPENYMMIISGLGKSSPNFLYILPIIDNGKPIGLLELASFVDLNINVEKFSEALLKNKLFLNITSKSE